MHDPTRVRRIRGLTVALASVVAVSSTAFGAGAFPALAQPGYETTVVTEPEYAPTEEVVTEAPPAYEAPPVVEVPTVPAYTPEAPAPVVTEAPPVVTEAPPVVTQEPEVVTQEPEVVTTTAAPEVTTEQEPVTTPSVATPEPTPSVATTATTAATTSAPADTSSPETTGSTSGTSTSPTDPAALETSPTTATSGTSTTATTEGSTSTVEAGETSTGETTGSTTAGGSTVDDPGSIEPAAGVTTTPEPQRAEASPEDIALAQNAKPVEEIPPPAPAAEIDKLRELVLTPPDTGAGTSAAPANLAAAEERVLQWQPEWVQYDKFYRPLIFNPYPEPLRIVYDVAGVPRLVLIPPFGRIVTEVRDAGSYNFSAMRLNTLGELIAIAVGNFFGGGYFPGPGLPPPPPPPPVRTLADVPVQVKYTNATYQPIVVRKIVDVGPDPTQGGAHKVLLDGVTPAWGQWKQNEQGVPQFEVNQTQSFPGMEAPAEGPLPGNYDLQLVSDSSPTGLSGKDITMIVAAVMAAAVGIGAIVLTVFLGRRRRPLH
jgi:hypothetical protein